MTVHATAGAALAGFSTALRFADLPDETLAFTKLVLLDSLGCMAAGSDTEDAATVAAAASASFGVAAGDSMTVAQRALVTGYGISASGSMDSYVPAKLHVTPSVIGAVLAEAERRATSGQALVCAVAVGLESAVRIADGFRPSALRARGWHSPGVIGPLSAALGSSRLLGLDASQTRHALGLAGSQSSGTFAAWGTPTVKFHQARAAVSGVLSAHLAGAGFTSSPDVFGAEDGGLLSVYAGGGDPESITDRLGVDWRMHDISLRRWPTPHTNAIAAVLDLVERHTDAAERAERIVVEVSADAQAFHVFDSPTTRFEAMNSIPLSAATALLAGTFDQEHLQPEWYRGDEVRSCAKGRVQISVSRELPPGSVRAFPIPLQSPEHVVEQHVPLGSRHRPIGRAGLVEKFVRNVGARLSATDATQLAAEVLTIEGLADVRPILARAGLAT